MLEGVLAFPNHFDVSIFSFFQCVGITQLVSRSLSEGIAPCVHSEEGELLYIQKKGNQEPPKSPSRLTQSVIDCFRSLHTVFHGGCTNLYSHQPCKRDPFSPRSNQHLLSFVFLVIYFLAGSLTTFKLGYLCFLWFFFFFCY